MTNAYFRPMNDKKKAGKKAMATKPVWMPAHTRGKRWEIAFAALEMSEAGALN